LNGRGNSGIIVVSRVAQRRLQNQGNVKKKPTKRVRRDVMVTRDSNGLHPASDLTGLLANLREIIQSARVQALRAVDVVQVRTCWSVGRHIVEFEQGGAARATYGARLLAELAITLTAEFGKGFDERNLRHMRGFYLTCPNWNALRTELSWTHYRSLLRVEDSAARLWYMNEAADQHWNTRALDRQIGTLYYERLLASQERQPVRDEAAAQIATLASTPRDFIRDPVMLEFLGLPNTGKLLESNLEDALIGHLQAFLLELGKGFAFVARQQRISTESKDFYLDLVFYNYLLKCFVLFELKTDELTHQDIGQMDMYVRMYDDLRRGAQDNPTVGIILCARKDKSVVRYSVLHGHEQLFATKYKLVLPSEEELRAELVREQNMLAEQTLDHPHDDK
jgi:predicted nuclease of restriction endonuclease-like (RecB) superfamily